MGHSLTHSLIVTNSRSCEDPLLHVNILPGVKVEFLLNESIYAHEISEILNNDSPSLLATGYRCDMLTPGYASSDLGFNAARLGYIWSLSVDEVTVIFCSAALHDMFIHTINAFLHYAHLVETSGRLGQIYKHYCAPLA